MFDLAVQNLELLNRLDLGKTWENTTQEERKDLLHVMLPECSVDVAAKRVIWIEAHPDFNVPFRLLNNLIVDQQRRLWITYPEADEDTCDIIEGKVQEMTEVKIAFPMPHNILTRAGKTISNVQFYEMDY